MQKVCCYSTIPPIEYRIFSLGGDKTTNSKLRCYPTDKAIQLRKYRYLGFSAEGWKFPHHKKNYLLWA